MAGLTHSLPALMQHLAHYLPAQGPIGVFIHHNTLHAFQHLPFEEAVVEAARTFGAQPYMTEAAYRQAWANRRIHEADVMAVLEAEGVDVPLRRTMLLGGLTRFAPETIHWQLESTALFASPEFEFWESRLTAAPEAQVVAARPRDGVKEICGDDIDDAVQPLLLRLTAAFLDQGLAYWPMPNRDEGFWRASLRVLSQPAALHDEELRQLPRWVRRWETLTSVEAVEAALGVLGVTEADREAVLRAELLALPGWAGLMHQLELDPSLAPNERVPASLMDFVAVRLLLTVAAVDALLEDPSAWRVAVTPAGHPAAQRLAEAAGLAEICQKMGLTVEALERHPAQFRAAVGSFDEWERRRVWHLAYERRHERQILLPLQQYAAQPKAQGADRVAAQVFFCLDEREESIRRHLEETDGGIETYGAAGFFGVAMNYAGIDDAHGAALCPVVVKPAHAVAEQAVLGHEDTLGRRLELRRAWARLAREAFVSSRTLLRGWLATTMLGVFSIFPLAARVLSPRRYAGVMKWLNASVLPEPRTELTFMRQDEGGAAPAEGLMKGFTVREKVDCVASVLGPAGLRKGLARVVVVLGHGSTCLNNPLESAYNCGACGGRHGGPNARIFAAMANRPEVRLGLREKGIHIPDDTWFVGGCHDTSNDDIDFYDLAAVPASHRADLDRVRASLDEARARSAHERTRRFESASNSTAARDGLHHVQERAEHLAEPRPEYGHCTNAVCVVGRRELTRGLFLDRRAFLVSYDATQDPDNTSLASLLGAVIPVCTGISLEYYFSFVDNERYGCGTKLPHNVTGLVGVMNGFESDLRTGLAWQMVEVHEPVRILFVLETTPERAYKTIRANPLLWQFLDNRWIRLAVVDPLDASRIQAYRGDGRWEVVEGGDEQLGQARTSLAWYHGRRENLRLARILQRETAC